MRDAAAAATMIATHLLASRLKATGESPDEKNVAKCFDAAELILAEALRREPKLRKMEDDAYAAREAEHSGPMPTPETSSGKPIR